MALEYSSGTIDWASADTSGTTKVISDLSFQPKALRFWTNGQNGPNAAANGWYSISMGFANSTTTRMCVTSFSANNSGSSACTREANTSAIITVNNNSTTQDGGLDLSAISSTGFTAIVRNQVANNVTVFWEAWGGDDITHVTVGMIVPPTAVGTQTHEADGFTSAGTNQVIMFAGNQAAANGTVTAENAGFCVGFATAAGQSGNTQQVMVGTSVDHSSVTMDTDGWGRSDNITGKVALAGAATLEHRANVESFGTNSFTLRWNQAAATVNRNIYMAIKGGSWQAGEYLHEGQTASNTVTITGFSTPVKGLNFITAGRAEDALNAATVNATISFGFANTTANRGCMSIHDRNGTAESWCRNTMNTDSVLSYSRSPNVLQRFDLNSLNSSGNNFQTIVDAVGQGVTSQWIGYLAFGDTYVPPPPPPSVGYSFGIIY
jgi:hypothetical protein